MADPALLERGRKLNGSGAPIFLDFYAPAHGQTIRADEVFCIDSVIPVPDGAPARFVLRRQKENRLVAVIPFLFRKSFTLPELFSEGVSFLKEAAFADMAGDTFHLKDGEYKVAVSVEADGTVIRSREHLFAVGLPKAAGRRKYCVHAYKDLVLREHGSMPCCNLVRNEKLLYSAYAEGGYDPWNNAAWQALRTSLAEGRPWYCHPTCPSLTDEPVSEEEFIRYSQAVDGKLCCAFDEEPIRYRAYVEGSPVVPVGPSRLGIMVGTVCNLDCIFCTLPLLKNRRTILTGDMLTLLEKHLHTCHRITFTGGEPLIYLGELRKLEGSFHENMTIQFVTNGVEVGRLKDFGGRAHLALRVSLNCANRDDYLYLHGKDCFDQIVDNIRQLKQRNPKTYVSLKFIIMKRTFRDIVRFAELCCELGVDDCTYSGLWIKTQSAIDTDEKIQSSDAEREQADELLAEARELLDGHGVEMMWSGWNSRPDDCKKKQAVPLSGVDDFNWSGD